jgi:hypothetical protein
MPSPSPVPYTGDGPGWWLLVVVLAVVAVAVVPWFWPHVRATRDLDSRTRLPGAGDRAGAAFGSGPAHTPAPEHDAADPLADPCGEADLADDVLAAHAVSPETGRPFPTWDDVVDAVKASKQAPVDPDGLLAAAVEIGLRAGQPRRVLLGWTDLAAGVYAPGAYGPVRHGSANGGGMHATCRDAAGRADLRWVCVWCRPRVAEEVTFW